jgi:large subunit ribosomal protein L25
MAEKKDIVIRAVRREGRGKNDARRARRNGQVPVTMYGGGVEAVSALAQLRDLAAVLRSDTGRNTIFTLEVEGVEATEVMFADRQIDPVRMRLIHADFKRLVKGEKIEATVPLRLIGEPIGVREQLGILEQIIRNVEIRCEPREIPEALEVDVTNLGVHDVLRVSDIPISEGIEILEPPDTVIATVGVVKEEPVEVVAVEGEVPTEPEVIGKGKKEDEGEAPAEGEKEKEKK